MVLALGCCIEKYLIMFAEVANDYTKILQRVETKSDQELTFMPSLVLQNSRLQLELKMQEIPCLFGVVTIDLLFPLFIYICFCYLGPLGI